LACPRRAVYGIIRGVQSSHPMYTQHEEVAIFVCFPAQLRRSDKMATAPGGSAWDLLRTGCPLCPARSTRRGSETYRCLPWLHQYVRPLVGIDERTLEVCAVEITSRNILAMPRCFLNCSIRFPAIGRSPPSPPMAPLTHARATTLSPDVGPMLSFRYARTPSPGRPTPSVPGHETTSCAPQNIWDGHGGDGGTVVIAEAAPKRR